MRATLLILGLILFGMTTHASVGDLPYYVWSESKEAPSGEFGDISPEMRELWEAYCRNAFGGHTHWQYFGRHPKAIKPKSVAAMGCFPGEKHETTEPNTIERGTSYHFGAQL